MSYKRRIYCQFCDFYCRDPEDMVKHIEKYHSEMIPEDMEPWQFFYYLKTGKKEGNCIICHNPTSWNNVTHKYNRFCNNPKCKEKYKQTFDKRMIGKYGKTSLMGEPDYQRKLLSHRKISGTYTWRDGSSKTGYTGSYEYSFLEFIDNILEFDPSDIIQPSPHTYYYDYKGEKHFYIPDFFIPSLNLEVEIKDGGDNPNKHQHMIEDREKEALKDAVMKSNSSTFNYLKVVDKKNDILFKYLEEAKIRAANDIKGNIIML